MQQPPARDPEVEPGNSTPTPLWRASCSVKVTEILAYSDTLGTWEKCRCNQIVTVTRGHLVTNQSFGTCQKSHCKQGVTVNSVTVSGEICTRVGELRRPDAETMQLGEGLPDEAFSKYRCIQP